MWVVHTNSEGIFLGKICYNSGIIKNEGGQVMSQTDFLIWITSLQNPVLNALASVFTFMGNEEFYFLVIPLVYWCFSKKVGFRLLYIFLLSVYVMAFIKFHSAISRPVGVEGVPSIFVESAEVNSSYPYDAFPSGHAQGSATLWGYLAMQISKPWFWVLAIILIFFTSVSRLYAGLHWPFDIIGGLLLAVIILMLAHRLEKGLTQLSRGMHWMLIILVPIVMIILFSESAGVKYAGFLLGAGMAYMWEGKYIRMSLQTPIWKKAVAYFIGIVGIGLLQVGLKAVFPELNTFDFIRYALIGIWAVFVAPWLFVKFGLYPTEDHVQPINKQRPVEV